MSYPRGKLHKDDEGQLTAAIAVDKQRGVVVLHFGKPVEWLAWEKDLAIKFAEAIIQKAKELPDA